MPKRGLTTALLCCAIAGPTAAPAAARPHKPFWLKHTTVTEYWPAPESWFIGRRVSAPGLGGKHRIDWLYSAHGISMEGDGVGLDGRRFHIESIGVGGWITWTARRSIPTSHGWRGGSPFWKAGGYWKNSKRHVTFPLDGGGWARGKGRHYVKPPRGISFATGPSLPLKYWRSLATDRRLIPRGSRVYIPAYRKVNGGWFRAADTGGAIIGRHVDVYRRPPKSPDGGRYLTGQRIYVIPPK